MSRYTDVSQYILEYSAKAYGDTVATSRSRSHPSNLDKFKPPPFN